QSPVPDYGPAPAFASSPTLNQVLTDEQEALLGCGHFWGTDCEVDGIDLLNAEASVLLQSFTGYAGVYASPLGVTQTTSGLAQPGTMAFQGPIPGTRFVTGQGNGKMKTLILPGARGPFEARYDPLVDGCISPAFGGAACAGAHALVVPAQYGASAGQLYRSEMAALRHTLAALLAALSSAPPTARSPPPLQPQGVRRAAPLPSRAGSVPGGAAAVLQLPGGAAHRQRDPAQHDARRRQQRLRPARLRVGERGGCRPQVRQAQRVRHLGRL